MGCLLIEIFRVTTRSIKQGSEAGNPEGHSLYPSYMNAAWWFSRQIIKVLRKSHLYYSECHRQKRPPRGLLRDSHSSDNNEDFATE